MGLAESFRKEVIRVSPKFPTSQLRDSFQHIRQWSQLYSAGMCHKYRHYIDNRLLRIPPLLAVTVCTERFHRHWGSGQPALSYPTGAIEGPLLHAKHTQTVTNFCHGRWARETPQDRVNMLTWSVQWHRMKRQGYRYVASLSRRRTWSSDVAHLLVRGY